MLGDVFEISVTGEHRKIVANANLREEGIDSTDLHSTATATIAQFSCADMILSVG